MLGSLFFTGSDRALDSLQFFLEYNLRLAMLPARVEHWQQGEWQEGNQWLRFILRIITVCLPTLTRYAWVSCLGTYF